MNWAISTFGGGFLYSSRTRELFNLNFAGDFVSKKGVSLFDNGRNIHHHVDTQSFMSGVKSAASNTMGVSGKIVHSFRRYIAHLANNTKVVLNFVYCWLFNCEPERNTCSAGEEGEDSSDPDSDSFFSIADINQFIAFRLGVITSTAFLFIVTTTLVSHTLRETQERMLKFTYLLQYHVTHNLPIVSLVCTHVLESLVFVPIMMGIYFFLFEFFSDQLLAFLVILLVWMGEIFSILSCRCRISIQYFPKIFMAYFLLFHIYFFTFPFGFSYLALLTTGLFMLHAMMHFWNVYEVAAYDIRAVHSDNPRAGLFGVAPLGSPTRESQRGGNNSPHSPDNNNAHHGGGQSVVTVNNGGVGGAPVTTSPPLQSHRGSGAAPPPNRHLTHTVSNTLRRYRSASESSTTSNNSSTTNGVGRYKLSPSLRHKTYSHTVNDYGYEKSEFTVFGNVAEDDDEDRSD
eukprot:gene23900-30178_t